MGHYQVLFSGALVDGVDPKSVRAKVQSELGLDERKLKQFFSGRTVVVRSRLSEHAAATFCDRMRALGAITRVKNLEPKVEDKYYRAEANRADHTLKDITAAFTTCPSCGHLQLDLSHCNKCGANIELIESKRAREDELIGRKVDRLRDSPPKSAGPTLAQRIARQSEQPAPGPKPNRSNVPPAAIRAPSSDRPARRGLRSWLKRSG